MKIIKYLLLFLILLNSCKGDPVPGLSWYSEEIHKNDSCTLAWISKHPKPIKVLDTKNYYSYWLIDSNGDTYQTKEITLHLPSLIK